MAGVLCSGSIVLDILVRPADQIVWGGTALVESVEQHLGGNGANTAYTLGKLGIPARLAGMVGRDAFGDFALHVLRSADVDVAAVQRSNVSTATTVALVKSAGERAFLHHFGSSADVCFDMTADLMRGMSHYHLGSPFGIPRLRFEWPRLLAAARAAGLTTSLDTHWDARGRWLEDLAPCLPHTDILFVNEDEARMLTGTADTAAAAARLRACGAEIVVVKLGAKGCAVFMRCADFTSPAFNVPVIDTTGAGDCFAGGYLAALQLGRDHAQAARLASAVAALSIQRLGAVDGVLGLLETEEWMRSQIAR